jgi:hypothetical protein
MSERNVDVMDKSGKVLHTFSISLGASMISPGDADYAAAALAAAKTAKLVPESDLASLTTRQEPPSAPRVETADQQVSEILNQIADKCDAALAILETNRALARLRG